MKKNFNFELTDLDGEIIKDKGVPLTARKAAVSSICANDTERTIHGEAWLDVLELAERIHAADGEVELRPEEVTKIKLMVEKFYFSPIIIGKMHRFLNE